MLRVHVAGMVFDSEGSEGFVLQPDGLTGWWGRPGSAVQSTPRPGAHGEVDSEVRLGARIVTLQGNALGQASHIRSMADRLSGLGAEGDRQRLVVEEDGDSTWSWCRVIGVPVMRSGKNAPPSFMVTLRCANPRRFGKTREYPVAANTPSVMENRGNFPASPRFIVRGPQPSGYSIVSPGEATFSVPWALPAGSTDVVDFATATVYRNGAELLNASNDPQTWRVPPAGAKQWQSAPTGSGSVVGEVTDTHV